MTKAPDPNRCPLCGQSNQCGQCGPANVDQPCWCFSVDIAAQTQAAIPPQAIDKACLCRRCARGESPDQP